MKKINNIIAFSLILIGFSSCSNDFFEDNETQYLTENRKNELIEESPQSVIKLIDGSLNGVYNTNIEGTGDKHDAFGMKSYHIIGDVMGIDVVLAKHGFFGFDYGFDYERAQWMRTSSYWNPLYKEISALNTIMNDFFKEAPKTEQLKQKLGEVRGFRGICYYYLINAYQHTYKGHETDLGVPLVLTIKDKNMPRATVQEVYNQIIDDLTFAVENNIVTRNEIKDVDQAVAATYLAKTYAAMEDWANVEKYADIAIKSAPLTDGATVSAGKWDKSVPSWLWGYDISNETYKNYYRSFYSHMDNTIPGYAGGLSVFKNIYDGLYKKISMTDIRKKLYINKTLFPEIAKKYSTLPKYANIKYATSNDFYEDVCFLRVEDPYLLLAEAKVELNKLDDAKGLLKDLMKLRDSKYDVSQFDTQDKLREEVRLQRRIELWGEGTSFYDLKRWQLGVDRTNSNHTNILTIDKTSNKWRYQIPIKEMDSNPNIGEQNPL